MVAVLFATFVFAQEATLKHSFTFEEGTYDETAVYDQVGELVGTLGGDKISIADGKATVSGASVNSDGWISMDGTELALNTYSSGVSIEVFLETGMTLNSSYTMLAYFGTSTPGNGCFWIQPTRAGNETRIETNNTSSTITALLSGYEVDDGEKHHLVAILSPDDLTYYLDGVVIAEASTGGSDYISTIGTDVANIFRGVDGWNDPNYNASLETFNIYEGVLDHATLVNHAGEYLGIQLDNVLLDTIGSTLGTFNMGFDPENFDYELTVPYGTTSLQLTAIPDANVSTVTMYDGLGNEITDGIVTYGEDGIDVEIIVTGADGVTTVSYYVAIYIDDPEKVATLSDIQLSAGSLNIPFEAYTTEYKAFILEGTTPVTVTGIPTWEGATVTGGGSIDMSSGEASTTITVTSEDGNAVREYTIDLFWTILEPGSEYYIVHELSNYAMTGNLNAAPMISPIVVGDSAQIFTIEESGVDKQYYLKNRKDLYVALAKTANVWDMTVRANLTSDRDSSRFNFEEFEPGRFIIHSYKRDAFENDLLGTNNTSVGSIFSDKWYGNNLTYWSLVPVTQVNLTNILSSLTLDVVPLRPVFDPMREEYSVVFPIGTTTVNVEAVANDAASTVSGAGAIDVSNGEGTITITVTPSGGGMAKNYYIHYKVDAEAVMTHSYTFADGTAQDMVGDADGEVNGGEIVDGAFTSTVDGDYIVLPAADIAINTYSSITLEAYIMAGENPGWTMLSYFGNNSGGSNCLWISVARNDDVSRVETATYGGATNVNTTEPSPGELVHVVGVISNDTVSFYYNGQLAGKNATNANYQIAQIENLTAWLGHGAYNDPDWKGTIYEFNIYEGMLDAETIAQRAINFPVEDESSNATLSDLQVNGSSIANFNPYDLSYSMMAESSEVPTVTATPKNENATVEIIDATELPGETQIVVTAADGTTQTTYTIYFNVVLSSDAFLTDIQVDGESLAGFATGVLTYEVKLPSGTTDVPTVTATASDAGASVVITAAAGIPGTTKIEVTAADGVTVVTYRVNFSLETSAFELNDGSIQVYPTITNNSITVKTNAAKGMVTVYNSSAQVVYKNAITSQEENISLPYNDMFVVKVETSAGMKTFKVIRNN